MEEVQIEKRYYDFLMWLKEILNQPEFVQNEFWRNLKAVIKEMTREERIEFRRDLDSMIKILTPEIIC